MEKINVNFAQVQLTWLRREAKRFGITVAEVLRRIVDAARGAR